MKRVASLSLVTILFGCAGPRASERPVTEDRLTVATVQSGIRPGMSQADVAALLGSPNVVAGDVGGKESWIYDKVSSRSTYVDGEFGGGFIFFGGSHDHGSSEQSQQTLTVVVKFDGQKKVESASYHASRF